MNQGHNAAGQPRTHRPDTAITDSSIHVPSHTPPAAANMESEVLFEAAHWFALLSSGTASSAERAEWQAWLGHEKSAQRDAWQRVEAISLRFSSLPKEGARPALHAVSRNRRQVLQTFCVLAGTGIAGWITVQSTPWQAWQADYKSATGEVRDIELPDGSRLWLNTASAVNVSFDHHLRRIVLIEGEIAITTASSLQTAQGHAQASPDPRPLVVDTPHGRLQALGTRFSVRLDTKDSLLSVQESAVRVAPKNALAGTQLVHAGWQVRFSQDQMNPATPADPSRSMWVQGMLVASDMRLEDLLAELSRYRRGHLGCDPAIAALRIVGVFSLTDTDHALEAITRTLPVKIQRRASWWVTLLPA